MGRWGSVWNYESWGRRRGGTGGLRAGGRIIVARHGGRAPDAAMDGRTVEFCTAGCLGTNNLLPGWLPGALCGFGPKMTFGAPGPVLELSGRPELLRSGRPRG